ncbi:hypothetical protein RB195_007906 [Necator americanus]|uniref:Uncharacterized protein n=1 Tax=Necator americanus TaxID=51031 RepID=A0ABR1C1U8_NECAM
MECDTTFRKGRKKHYKSSALQLNNKAPITPDQIQIIGQIAQKDHWILDSSSPSRHTELPRLGSHGTPMTGWILSELHIAVDQEVCHSYAQGQGRGLNEEDTSAAPER